ncbi:MAG: integral rane sensor signal transduction histidine kinase [Fibrobacteres bacterium]|nr:integral rane sensor signal transduction histidine kinase [Fibrobacterota bacterium]
MRKGLPEGIVGRIALALTWSVAAGLLAELILRKSGPPDPDTDFFFLVVLTILAIAAGVLMTFPFSRSSSKAPGAVTEPESAGSAGDAFSQMGQTFPIIFHEIKNFASTMKGNTVLLRRDLPSGTSTVSLERLERATEQIERLAKEVLDLSLLGRPSEVQPLDLQALLRTCAESYFKGLGIAFSFSSDKAILPIQGEARKLEQVFLNLFKNSLEAGASHIAISIHTQQDRISVMIEDNGKGCTTAEIEKMFDAYHSFKRGKGGSGLGLFLVKAIIEGHGGTIVGLSKNAKVEGATGMFFIIHFPNVPVVAANASP